jgi:hypothetical protein
MFAFVYPFVEYSSKENPADPYKSVDELQNPIQNSSFCVES